MISVLLHVDAAADRDPLRGDPAALLRHEQQRGVGHVLDRAEAVRSPRLRLHGQLQRRGRPVGLLQELARGVCRDGARRERVDGDAVAVTELMDRVRINCRRYCATKWKLTSLAQDAVRLSCAALAAAYMAVSLRPILETMEPTLMMRPPEGILPIPTTACVR